MDEIDLFFIKLLGDNKKMRIVNFKLFLFYTQVIKFSVQTPNFELYFNDEKTDIIKK